jgi:fructose-1,6-bisphosphatase/inositol monophosphatase family enzyme
MAVAVKGRGVCLDGAPVSAATQPRPPVGFVGYKIRKQFDRQLPLSKRRSLGPVSTLRCAGAEYIEILAGRADFCLYRMTKPWDHAAGVLMLAEAGGGAVRFDGQPYGPAQPLDAGLIAAMRWQTLSEVQALLEAAQMPLLAEIRKS